MSNPEAPQGATEDSIDATPPTPTIEDTAHHVSAPPTVNLTHIPAAVVEEMMQNVTWRPDDTSPKQAYVFQWMCSVMQKGYVGGALQEAYTDLLPPETLFSREVIHGSFAPQMYKDLRDLIHDRQGGIEKRRGLQIKRALSEYYSDPQSTQDATDLAREAVEQEIPTLSSRRIEYARSSSRSSDDGRGGVEQYSTAYLQPTQATAPARMYLQRRTQELDRPAPVDTTNADAGFQEGPFRVVPPGAPTGTHETYTALHRRNANRQQHQSAQHATTSTTVSPHAVSVLSRLGTRFKDRSDKFGGDDGENWEDIFSSYMNCVTQWGVPEHAALRNVENILAGQARTYYKRKVQANPRFFKNLEEVNVFMLSIFHGEEAQEATLEHLNALSLYDLAQEKGSLAEGLKAVRAEIVKHGNLVPIERQTDQDQRRWLKQAVRSFKWTRATTARAHELDFAKLYSTLKCQAIEEDKGREMRAERRDSRARVGDKSLGRRVLFGDVYGRANPNPRHHPYTPREKKPFNGNCFGCGKQGYRRFECPTCSGKPGYDGEGRKAMKAIHETRTVAETNAVMDELCIQYGENWMRSLMGQDTQGAADEGRERAISFASAENSEESKSSSSDEGNDSEDGYAAQFGIQYLNVEEGSHPASEQGKGVDITYCAGSAQANQKSPSHSMAENIIPSKVEILPINASTPVTADQFEGVCLDTGASTSVSGRRQAEAYAAFIGCKILPKATRRVFRFGAHVEPSIGTIVVRIPTPGDAFIEIRVDIVAANIPLLIGLDALDKFSLYINNVRNLLVHDKLQWAIPLTRHGGHMYYRWTKEVLFTMPELRKMHHGFFHPSTDKMFNLIKRAKLEDATPQVRQMLEDISKRCNTCQFSAPKPRRFTASISDGIVFNRTVILDLMWIHSKPVLHVIDKDTHYSAARFLEGESIEQVWQTFLLCWVSTYVGYPDILKADAGSVFTSRKWNKMTSEVGVAVEIAGVESSNSMGVGERYHDPLRRIYNKVLANYPGHSKEVILALANKGMNDTLGPEGLVPSLLLFGVVPRVSAATGSLSSQEERLLMMQTARNEMEAITARLRMKTVLRKRASKAAHMTLTEGDPVLVWRKGVKGRSSSWTGPYSVLKIEGKLITVLDERHKPREFSASSIKPYTVDEIEASKQEEGERDNTGMDNAPESESETEESEQSWSEPDDVERDPDYEEHMHEWHDREDDLLYSGYGSGSEQYTHLTEVLPIGDPRGKEERFHDARDKEIKGLEDMQTWERVDGSSLPEGANVMGSRFALSLKHAGTEQEVAKARLVVQGHTDKEKFNVVHDSTTLHQRSTRLIVCIAGMFGFDVWSHDITQAYLQSDSPLQRNVFLRPPPELKFPKGQLLRLVKPLYGLADSGDYWGSTNSRHHVRDLGMVPTTGDLSLYFRRSKGELCGLSGIVVDDTLQCGTQAFFEHTGKTVKMFRSKARTREGIVFAGIHVDRNVQGGFVLSQCDYAQTLAKMDKGATYQELRSARAKLAWLTNSRPDVLCAVAKLAQVKDSTFDDTAVKGVNKVVAHVQKCPKLGIVMPSVDLDSASIMVFTDAALGNNEDLSSQIGFVIAVTDNAGRANIVEYASRKCRRVTHSSLGGEIMAFTAGFDAGFALKYDMKKITRRNLPLYMLTDSRGLFDMITRNSYSAERRLMIDMAAIRQAYRRRDIDGVAHVAGSDNPADAMTKIVQSKALIDMMAGKMTVHPTQWVVRRRI